MQQKGHYLLVGEVSSPVESSTCVGLLRIATEGMPQSLELKPANTTLLMFSEPCTFEGSPCL